MACFSSSERNLESEQAVRTNLDARACNSRMSVLLKPCARKTEIAD